MSAAAEVSRRIRRDDGDEQQPLRFTRVPDAAKRLPPLERDVLFGLLSYCRYARFCWPGQRRLARDIGRSLTRINAGIAGLVARGAVTKRMQPGRQTCVYAIDAAYWVPRAQPKKSPVPAGFSVGACSAGGTESDSRKNKNIPPEPPISTRSKGGTRLDEQSIDEGDRGSGGGAIAAPTTTRHGGSRRTPYGQPRQPRAPRKLRQRWRRRNEARAYLDAAAEIEARATRVLGRAPPVALAPEQEVITPAEWHRRQQRQSRQPDRGFLDVAEAIERERRGAPPIFDPQPWTRIGRNVA
jgi:hypothetical protein